MTGKVLQAVLFDMDGTLVETEQHWDESLAELARRLGGRLSARARAALVGADMATSMRVLDDDLGLVRTPEQRATDGAWVMARTEQLLARSAPWRPGARELLGAVRAAGLATALVTTTPRRLADHVLAHIGELAPGEPAFDVTVCGDEVPANKPDPAPYRQAMAALDVPADACVVIEDSVTGATAGRAAGAAVLWVPSLQPLERVRGVTLGETLVGIGVPELARVLADRGLGAGVPAGR